MTADLRTQLAEVLASRHYYGDPEPCAQCRDDLDYLLPHVERISAAARAEGAAEALRDAADTAVWWSPDHRHVVPTWALRQQAELRERASLSPTVTPTTEEDPK